jgi:hypothetical protein
MVIGVAGLVLISILAIFSMTDALGAWLAILLLHELLVEFGGEFMVHFPLYCGVIILFLILVRRQWSILPTNFLVLVALLIIVMSISSLFGLSTNTSMASLMNYSKSILLAVLLGGCLKSDIDIRKITIYCIAGLLLGCTYTMYQHVTGNYGISGLYEQRATGLSADPNDTAMLYVSGIPLVVFWIFRSKNLIFTISFFIALAVLAYSILLTGSRGGILTAALIALALYIRKPSIKNTFLGLIMLCFLIYFAPATFFSRVNTLKTGQENHGGSSMDNRMELQIQGVKIFFDNMITGVGPGNFGRAFIQKVSTGKLAGMGGSTGSTDFIRSYGVAHNMHLEMFVENGIFGGILFEAIIFSSILSLLRYDKKTRERASDYSLGYCLTLSLMGLVFAGFFLSQGKNPVMWFIIGIAFSVPGMAKYKSVIKK